MIAGAGHYPMAEQPDEVLAAVLPFLAGMPGERRADGGEASHG